ncbi:MAG: HAD family hydrolase [Alkalicoccus sp.]|nr:MAG: HAD family hydrolase [Alkalicoccus sp.]
MKPAVFFDLDDTILWDEKSIQLAFDRTCSYAEETYSVDASALEKAVRSAARKRYASYDTYDFTQMIGINPFEGLWGAFDDEEEGFDKLAAIIKEYQLYAWYDGLKECGTADFEAAEDLASRFIEERKRSPVLFDDALEVLDKLQGRFTLVLLTNGSPQLQQTKLTITPEIAPYFDQVIISGAFGRGKPDASIFEYALEVSGADREKTWMVGDNLKTDILGASRTGITSVWLNRFEKEPMHEITADYTIQDLHELLPLLSSTNGDSQSQPSE